jgi:hypothetical protein
MHVSYGTGCRVLRRTSSLNTAARAAANAASATARAAAEPAAARASCPPTSPLGRASAFAAARPAAEAGRFLPTAAAAAAAADAAGSSHCLEVARCGYCWAQCRLQARHRSSVKDVRCLATPLGSSACLAQ